MSIALQGRARGLMRHEQDSLITMLRHALPTLKTTTDSLKTYLDIYDITGRKRTRQDVLNIYQLARRCHNTKIQLEMLRELSIIDYNNDSLVDNYVNLAMELPSSNLRMESTSCMRISNAHNDQYINTPEVENQRVSKLNILINQYTNLDDKTSELQRAELLFKLCVYLRQSISGKLLLDHVNQLEKAINKIPFDTEHLLYQYYNFAMNTHLMLGNTDKVIKTAKLQLDNIDKLSRAYQKDGREYHRYDVYRLKIYSQLLGCYKRLTPEQIEQYYKAILNLAANDRDCRDEYKTSYMADIFYNMAHKNYATALPMLKTVMHSDRLRTSHPLYYDAYVKAASETNDREALSDALQIQNQALETRLSNRMLGSARQLQFFYDMRELSDLKNRVETINDQLELTQRRHQIWIIIIGGVILLALVISVAIARRHIIKSARSLKKSNHALKTERDSIISAHKELLAARDNANIADRMKNEFIHNISHEISEPTNAIVGYSQLIIDSVEGPKRVQLERHIKVIEHNVTLLRSLVNDVLDSVDTETSRLNATTNNFSLPATIETVVESVRSRLKPDVVIEIIQDNDCRSPLVDNDPRRVEQVIMNMLTNACKYTSRGKITISYTIDHLNHSATVMVADTGIGIPPQYAEFIFSRYGQVNRTDSGLGIGLHVCRIIADIIGGSIVLDTSYTQGARFIFTFPSNGIPDPRHNKPTTDSPSPIKPNNNPD